MQRDSRRYLVLILLLALGAGASLLLPHTRAPTQPLPKAESQVLYSVHIDLAGWYETTPNERVVAGPYDLRFTSLPGSLPLALGAWKGVELPPDSEVEALYAHPELVMRREYTDPSGRPIWLTAIGSRGPKSYSLFEHTPAICYASSGWSTIVEDTTVISLRQGTIVVARGVYSQGQEQRAVYSWYQWDDAERDAAKGVTSWRVATDSSDCLDAAQSRLDGFLGILFHEVLPWHRF